MNNRGATIAGDTSSHDGRIILLNAEGVEQWRMEFATNGYDRFDVIGAQQDGGFVVAGTTTASFASEVGTHYPDIFVAKLSGSGELLWLRETCNCSNIFPADF